MELLQVLGGSDFQGVLIIVVIVLVVVLIIRYTKSIDTVTHHSQQPFENLQFSSQEFYTLVETLVREKQMPNLKMGRVYHLMHGVFSGKREYLRVQYQNYFFDICAAPFAKDFFVSYRQGTLRVLIRNKREKTFYEMDTENMFHASVKLCYDRAIESLQEKKARRLTNDATAQFV